MKLTVEKTYLANALGVTGRAVSSRNTLPILSNVLIETQDDRIQITATDLDTAIRTTLPAQVITKGEIAIPAGVLSDIIGKLPDAPVTLQCVDGKTSIRSGKSDYMLLSLPAIDFPPVPNVQTGVEVVMPQAKLKSLLKQTAFAASKEETRSILMGVLFELRGKKLSLVATDTHRLAYTGHEVDVVAESPMSAIVPAKPLHELLSLLKDDGNVTIRFGASQVQFETADTVLCSRLLDGQFPNWEKVVPQESVRRIALNRDTLIQALRRVYIVAKQSSEKVVFNVKGGLIEITAESSDIGRAFEEVPCELTGGDIKIAMNCRYVIEMCSVLSGDTVTINLNGALNPGLLKAEGSPQFMGVLMPMQV